MAGYAVENIKSNDRGMVDVDAAGARRSTKMSPR